MNQGPSLIFEKNKTLTWTSDYEAGGLAAAVTTATVFWQVSDRLYIGSQLIYCGILVYCLYAFFRLNRLQGWEAITAKIQSCSSGKQRYSSQSLSDIHTINCIYTYEIDSKKFHAKRVTLYPRDSMTEDIDLHNRLMRKLRNRHEITVYVDPNDPTSAVIFKNMNAKSRITYLLFLLITASLWVMSLWLT